MEEIDGLAVADRLRIADRLSRYSWSLDSADLPTYLECFADDGILRHPKADGSPAAYLGHEEIADFVSRGFADRPSQSYATQHQFNAVRMAATGDDGAEIDAYVMIFRHEFHRQYWPRGSSWRMGTWHARLRRETGMWRLTEVDVRMWTDTAWTTGTALAGRAAGLPGVRD